jgi:hypothetical protein
LTITKIPTPSQGRSCCNLEPLILNDAKICLKWITFFAGWMVVSNEIAQGVLGLAISFWGGKGNRPGWIATCATFQALTCFLLLLPHLAHGTSPASTAAGGKFAGGHKVDIQSKGPRSLTSWPGMFMLKGEQHVQ